MHVTLQSLFSTDEVQRTDCEQTNREIGSNHLKTSAMAKLTSTPDMTAQLSVILRDGGEKSMANSRDFDQDRADVSTCTAP